MAGAMRNIFRTLLLAEAIMSSRADAHTKREIVGLFLFIICLASAFMYSAEPRKWSWAAIFLGILLPVVLGRSEKSMSVPFPIALVRGDKSMNA
jgi:hypothetical protein